MSLYLSYRRLLYVLALILLFGCSEGQPWATKDISGLMPELKFQLTDVKRHADVTADDYREQIKLIYFGYTQCPDVCSPTLLRLQTAVSALGEAAKQVRILFVSVDPKRDTPEVLERYTSAFGTRVVGLRGGQEALRTLTKRYRVTYGYDKPDADGHYKVSHSSAVYVFDLDNEARLLLRPDDSIGSIDRDLLRLITEAR